MDKLPQLHYPDNLEKEWYKRSTAFLEANGIMNWKLLDLYVRKEDPDAVAELATGYTDEFDGTAIPAVVDVISTSADDDGSPAGTGCRTLTLFGIDENDGYIEETITMNGVTAVATTTKWKRLIAMWGVTFGSGLKCAGTITCHEHGAATETYMTIATNGIHTLSTRFYIAANYKAAIIYTAALVEQATGAAAAVLTSGTKFYPVYSNAKYTEESNTIYTVLPIQAYELHPFPRIFTGATGGTKLTWMHQTINTGANSTTSYHIALALWRA